MDKVLILNELKRYKNFTKDTDFARFLGITPQCLRGWYDRNTYDINILHKFFPEISADYLINGSGSMLRIDATASSLDEAQAKQTIIGNDNCHNVNTACDTHVINELLERIKEKDDQISRLITIIEKSK